jgi:hypothetical protein
MARRVGGVQATQEDAPRRGIYARSVHKFLQGDLWTTIRHLELTPKFSTFRDQDKVVSSNLIGFDHETIERRKDE